MKFLGRGDKKNMGIFLVCKRIYWLNSSTSESFSLVKSVVLTGNRVLCKRQNVIYAIVKSVN